MAALRGCLSSPLARQRGSHDDAGLARSTEAAVVRRRLAELSALESRLQALAEAGHGGGGIEQALRDVVDVDERLARAARGGILEPVDLVDIACVLQATVVAAPLLGDPDDALRAALEGLQPDPAFADRLARSLDLSGEEPGLADAASPELAQARAHARRAKLELAAAAERLVARADLADALADKFWTEREGRVVLPIRAGALSRGRGADGVAGIIHGSSSTGQTFYVEPTALVEDNNRLRQAQARAREEERRVLAELSAAVRERAEAIGASVEAMVALDRILARLRLSQRLAAIEPNVYDVGDPGAPALKLPGARHPTMVLAQSAVVPNDLGIGSGHCLVVSGPNAGGKTVALKAIGLCVLMAQLGLWLPTSAAADVPLFRHVITDVGDDQSIAASLSTFTAHLHHVHRALGAAEDDPDGTLVLLDEVAVGTEPEQGAALAEAILTRLVELGATVVVTTHYERLKLLATHDARFTNAAVGFDLEHLRPTFTLTVGLPGSSSALAVARRLGLSPVVLERAHALLDDTRLAVDVLLGQLEATRVTLATEREAVQSELRELAVRDARLTARERGEEEAEAARRAKAHKAATVRLGELQSEIVLRRKQLRHAKLESAPDGQAPAPDAKARAFASDAREEIRSQALPRGPVEGQPPERLQVGDRVYVASLDAEGDVVAFKGQRVTVQLPRLKTTVGRDALRLRRRPASAPPRAAAKPDKKSGTARRYFGSDAQPFEPGLDNVVDLRGERADEAVTMMEVFLDRAVAEDREVVLLRHGHGSGAVRKAVREQLARLQHVVQHRPGLSTEGGDAVTVVWVSG